MEGPLEVKGSTVGTEEPIKSEAPVQSPGSSDHSDGAASPPPNCSICLGKLINTSFTDSCLHQFCFTCLLQWSKIKTECPLCKQTFKSIIHNVRSEEDYDQYHVPRELVSQMQQPQVMALDFNLEVDGRWDVGVHRFLYRTTMIGNRRNGVSLNLEPTSRREQLPNMEPQASREERRRRRVNPTNYRHNIYRLGIWATALPDVFGRFRECSADYYRREPWELNRLVPWLNRDLQVLLNNNASHIAYVMRIILEALSQYDIRSPEFRDLVRPYFGVRTDHFVHELLNYARTNFDVSEYDRAVTYASEGISNQYVPTVVSPTSSSSSTTSDDSDVRVLDEAIDLRVNTEIPSVGPHQISMPGPSTVGQAFQIDPPPYNPPDVLTISSDSSCSCDDCEVIGYVKPRHARTPEIIELVSSDPEEITASYPSNENPVPPSDTSIHYGENLEPGTSYNTKKEELVSSSSSDSSDSDSDSVYTSSRNRRYGSRTKKRSSKKDSAAKRRNRSLDTRNGTRRSRNLSSSGESETRRRRRKSRRSSARSSAVKVRMSSSSDCSCHEIESKNAGDDKRSRKYYTRGTVHVRKDLIKMEDRYDKTLDESSGSGGSSTETDNDTKHNKSGISRKSKRKYFSSSSDYEVTRSERMTSTRSKVRQVKVDSVSTSKESERKSGQRSRSSSTSSYLSQKEKSLSGKRRDPQRDRSECESRDRNHSAIRDLSRKDHESKYKYKSKSKFKSKLKSKSKSKSKGRRVIRSSSDTEEDCLRPSSKCSNHSNQSYAYWKKSKYKGKHKNKERNRSSSRTRSLPLNVNGTNSTMSMSLKSDTHASLKHSDLKDNLNSKERHMSHKSHKESRHRKSQMESKSKSKKKRRRIRMSSSSNSE